MRACTFLAIVLMFTIPIQASRAQTPNLTPLKDLPSGTYTLDKAHASLIWKVNHMGLSHYTARFTDFDATLQLNPTKPTQSTLTATINPASVETDFPNPTEKDFDAKLRGAEWFNTSKFPTIQFTSTALTQISSNTGRLTGNLTFLGVTKPVTLNVTFNGGMINHPFAGKPVVGFSATGKLKRSDFGFNTYIPTIGDEVQLMIEAEFFGPTPVANPGL